jgi:RsmE family RNA methyltransferase
MLLLETDEVASDGVAVIGGRRAQHVLSILKAAPGRRLRAGIVNGASGEAEVLAVSNGSVRVRCVFDSPGAETGTGMILMLALPRPKVLKRLWAPLASLGVDRVFLTNAARVERDYFDTHWILPEHFGPLLREGLEQSCRTRLPEVSVCRRLRPFVEDELPRLCPGAVRLMADPAGAFKIPGDGGSGTVLAVGPEGGWTDFERALLADNGFSTVSLGPHPLRTDVACMALIAAVKAGRGI